VSDRPTCSAHESGCLHSRLVVLLLADLFGLMSQWLSWRELRSVHTALGDPRVRSHFRTLLLPEDLDLLESLPPAAATSATLCR